MSLFRYSGLATKVRAMSGKLAEDEDFDQIGSLDSVPAVIAWLKGSRPMRRSGKRR